MKKCSHCGHTDVKFVYRSNVKEATTHEDRLYWQKNGTKNYECQKCKTIYGYGK